MEDTAASGKNQGDYERQLAEARARREADLRTRAFLQAVLEPGAFERMRNIAISNPDLYRGLTQMLMALYQEGKLPRRVTEEELKALLARVLSQRREPTIKFLRK